MLEQQAPHRVKAARCGEGFTQGDMAFLLGYKSDSHVSRVERAKKPPSVSFVIGSAILFGRSIEDLFKALHDEIAEDVMRQAYLLREKLSTQTAPSVEKRCELLTNVMTASIERQKNQNV